MKKLKYKLHGLVTAFLVLYLVGPPLFAHAALGAANALMNFGMVPELANYITKNLVNVDSSGNLVIPVATSKALSVTVGGTEKLAMSSAGAVTAASTVTATAGGITATAGDITATAGEFIASASGKTLSLQEATAGTKCMGTGTHNGTTAVTVSTTCATTASRIFITNTSDPTGSTAAECWVTNIVNATSFDVDCDAADDSTFNWIIFHESA